jgi:hypothetical protein
MTYISYMNRFNSLVLRGCDVASPKPDRIDKIATAAPGNSALGQRNPQCVPNGWDHPLDDDSARIRRFLKSWSAPNWKSTRWKRLAKRGVVLQR